MRARSRDGFPLAKVLGTILIIVLPVIIVSQIRSYISGAATISEFALSFLLTSLGAQAGLVVRRWGKMRLGMLLLDLLLATAAGAVSFGVVRLASAQGGGAVDPALVAIVMAYLSAIWSGQNR